MGGGTDLLEGLLEEEGFDGGVKLLQHILLSGSVAQWLSSGHC